MNNNVFILYFSHLKHLCAEFFFFVVAENEIRYRWNGMSCVEQQHIHEQKMSIGRGKIRCVNVWMCLLFCGYVFIVKTTRIAINVPVNWANIPFIIYELVQWQCVHASFHLNDDKKNICIYISKQKFYCSWNLRSIKCLVFCIYMQLQKQPTTLSNCPVREM